MMGKDSMNNTKYVYIDDKESNNSNGMLSDNIKIRCSRYNSASECKCKYDKWFESWKPDSNIKLYRWSMSNKLLLVNMKLYMINIIIYIGNKYDKFQYNKDSKCGMNV